jgi:sulfur-carrier protein
VVEVHLWSGLRRLTDGQAVVTVQAATVGEMLAALEEAHPALGSVLTAGVSVSVDGQLVSSRLTPITDGCEIYLLQRIKGG